MVILQNCYLQNLTTWLYSRDKFATTFQQQECGGKYCLRITILCLQVIYFYLSLCYPCSSFITLCIISNINQGEKKGLSFLHTLVKGRSPICETFLNGQSLICGSCPRPQPLLLRLLYKVKLDFSLFVSLKLCLIKYSFPLSCEC